MTLPRCASGIPGLDEILDGGPIAHRSYLIVGSAGSGKTILSLQFLLEGHRLGESGLYISLAEAGEEIRENAAGFGWSLEGIELLDLSPAGTPPTEPLDEYHIFPPSEVEQLPTWQAIYDAVLTHRPDRLIIDSMTQLRYLSPDEYQFRKNILSLVAFLNHHNCTSLLAFEPSELEHETSVALAVNGVLRLRTDLSPSRVIDLRSVQVEKLRGSSFMSGRHPLRITSEGMTIFPHRIERPEETKAAFRQLSSGLPSLDALLGGGIESGTTTLISGPTGAGKSTLGLHFLAHAARQGQRAILYTFEESVNSIMARCRGVGQPIDALVRSGALRIVRVNPLELYPDEFLAALREDVEVDGRQVVMVDSLRGYSIAMEEFGSLVANIQNLSTYLNRHQVTTLLINEVEHVTGDLRVTEIGVSYLADNVLLLRYAECGGEIIKIVGCLKKRIGHFESALRELRIGSEGITVGQQLSGARGLLTGVPEFTERWRENGENPAHLTGAS